MSSSTDGTYYTHDNGGRPYRVEVKKNHVAVYDNHNQDKDEPIYSLDAKQVFIGGEDGNSILCHIKGLEYLFIGREIYRFTAKAEIIEYKSPIHGTDVAYPYAIDEDGRYYLMRENTVIEQLDGKTEDPYDYLYKRHTIKDHCVGKEYRLTYTSDPEQYYDCMGLDLLDYTFYYVSSSGEKRALSKEEYVKVNNKFGEEMGFHRIPNKHILFYRD